MSSGYSLSFPSLYQMLWDRDHVCFGVTFSPLGSPVTQKSRALALAPAAGIQVTRPASSVTFSKSSVTHSPDLATRTLTKGSPSSQLTNSLLRGMFLNPALYFNKIILLPNLSTNKMIENSKHVPATPS